MGKMLYLHLLRKHTLFDNFLSLHLVGGDLSFILGSSDLDKMHFLLTHSHLHQFYDSRQMVQLYYWGSLLDHSGHTQKVSLLSRIRYHTR